MMNQVYKDILRVAIRRKKHDQDAEKAREEVYSCNQGPNEDEAADEEDSCFGGTLI